MTESSDGGRPILDREQVLGAGEEPGAEDWTAALARALHSGPLRDALAALIFDATLAALTAADDEEFDEEDWLDVTTLSDRGRVLRHRLTGEVRRVGSRDGGTA